MRIALRGLADRVLAEQREVVVEADDEKKQEASWATDGTSLGNWFGLLSRSSQGMDVFFEASMLVWCCNAKPRGKPTIL